MPGPTNFSNIKRMFSLNKDDAAEQADKAFGQVAQKSQAASNAINGVQTSSGTYNSNIQQDKDLMGKKVGEAEDSMELLKTPGGQQQLLTQNAKGNYGAGARNLDAALTNSASRQMTQQLGQQYGNLRQMMTQKQSLMDQNNAQFKANQAAQVEAQKATDEKAAKDQAARAEQEQASREFDALMGSGGSGYSAALPGSGHGGGGPIQEMYQRAVDVFGGGPEVKRALAMIYHGSRGGDKARVSPAIQQQMLDAAQSGNPDQLINAFRAAAYRVGAEKDLFKTGTDVDRDRGEIYTGPVNWGAFKGGYS